MSLYIDTFALSNSDDRTNIQKILKNRRSQFDPLKALNSNSLKDLRLNLEVFPFTAFPATLILHFGRKIPLDCWFWHPIYFFITVTLLLTNKVSLQNFSLKFHLSNLHRSNQLRSFIFVLSTETRDCGCVRH